MPKTMRETLIEKIEDARVRKNEWSRASNKDTWRYWQGRLEAFQYALDLLNWKDAGMIN